MNTINFRRLSCLIMLVMIAACSSSGGSSDDDVVQEEVIVPLDVRLNPINNIGYVDVDLSGTLINYDSQNIREQGFCWSTSPNPEITDEKIQLERHSINFDFNLRHLSLNTTYYVRAFVRVPNETIYSNELSFHTKNVAEVCQDTWNADIAGGDDLISIAKLDGGGYIALGYSYRYLGGLNADPIIMRFNDNCELVWGKTYDDGTLSTQAMQVIVDSNNHIVFVSRIYRQSGGHTMLVKMDLDGNVIWETILDEGADSLAERYYPLALTESGNGNYLVVGSRIPESTAPNSKANFLLVKFNNNGVPVFNKNYGESDVVEHAWGVVENPVTEDIMIFGSTDKFGNEDFKLVKVDAGGNFISENIHRRGGQDRPRTILNANDGNILVSGFSSSWGIGEYDIMLGKFDWDCNLLWDRGIGVQNETIQMEGPNSIYESPQNEIYIAARRRDYGSKAFAVKTDAEGNEIWRKTAETNASNSTFDGFRSVIELNNGEILFTGHAHDVDMDPNQNHTDGWIVKFSDDN